MTNENSKIELCKYIQTNVDKLSEIEINQIFKILYESKSTYSKNNHGVFCNLSWLNEEILDKIYTYIQFCLESHNEIHRYEMIKSLMTDNMSTREKQDDKTLTTQTNSVNMQNNCLIKSNKLSSSLKFYLLKKRFLKKTTVLNNNISNSLVYEEYII
jgi:hypothetical protein